MNSMWKFLPTVIGNQVIRSTLLAEKKADLQWQPSMIWVA